MKITQRKEEDVPPAPAKNRRVNRALEEIMDELTRIEPGMVMVIEAEDEKAIRATKLLVTRAGNELGIPLRHWHTGTEVFAKPVRATHMGMERSERASRGDHRD